MEVFRTEPNGAVRKIFAFPIQPTRRYLDRHSEIYLFSDPDPPTGAVSYYARGLIGGVAGANSPISNVSRPTIGMPLTEIRYLALRDGRAVWPQWLALIEAQPSRFVVGTDASHRSRTSEEMKFASVQAFLRQLSPATRDRVARENILALVGVRPAR